VAGRRGMKPFAWCVVHGNHANRQAKMKTA
jgi:hypothetical protein